MIDTHCHLYDELFSEDLNLVIARAKESGVQQIILPNIDASSWDSLLKLTQTSELICLPMLGLHPCYVKDDYGDVLRVLHCTLEAHRKEIVAIGEIGIDLYWDKTTREIQENALRTQLDWALAFNLPVALHVRDAFEETFNVLRAYTATGLRGVFHCFTGTSQEVDYITKHHPDFYFGIGGVLTYKNSGLQDVVKNIPLHRLVLETDAPYLSPVPHRGKRNEPAFLQHVAKRLSDVLEMSEQEIIKITTDNASTLFQLATAIT